VTTVQLDDHEARDYDDYGTTQLANCAIFPLLRKGVLDLQTPRQKGETSISQYFISPEPAHTVLAQTYIGILLQPDLDIGDITDSLPIAEICGCKTDSNHAQCGGVAHDWMERLFDPDRRHFSIWISMQDMDGTLVLGNVQLEPKHPRFIMQPFVVLEASWSTSWSRVDRIRIKVVVVRAPRYMSAVVSGHTSIARLLLEHAADANARDMNNVTPLHEAVKRGNLDIAQLLHQSWCRCKCLLTLPIRTFLLNSGADVEFPEYRMDNRDSTS
jgi:hypothetical protein